MSITLTLSLLALILSSLLIKLLFAPARKVNLIDLPDGKRKLHANPTPLIGGITILSSFTIVIFVLKIINQQLDYLPLLLCLFIIAIIGLLDDLKSLSSSFRLIVQCLVAVIIFFTSDTTILNLGDILDTGNILTHQWALPITALAILSSMNALNMIDGIDGLACSISLITLLSLLFFTNELLYDGLIIVVLCAAILPVCIANLSLLGKSNKIFLGDTGSMALGFIIAYLLIQYSAENSSTHGFRPITAVWLFAIPLMDMATITIRRLYKGNSPFNSDREHLHHLFQHVGFSDKKALVIVSVTHLIFVFIGIITHYYSVSESVLFHSFIGLFIIYYLIMQKAWKKVPIKNTLISSDKNKV